MSLSMTDDASDLLAARAGDQEAFARLYDRHAGVVLSLCRRRCTAAEDALQETFIRAYRMLPRLDEGAELRPWLYAIARRVCAEQARAARRRSHHEERAVSLAAGNGHAVATVAGGVERAEALERLTAALDGLADDERLAIHLFYLEADPVAAASAALGLSRSGFYKLLGRARERLAGQLREVVVP